MLNRDMPDGGRLEERLIRFADFVADESPLYGVLSRAAATDPVALEILGDAPHGQPAANILLAAVQFLLLSGIDHPLATHYPIITPGTEPLGDAAGQFADFLAAHVGELRPIVATRTVQTNEVRRCTALLPCFSSIAAEAAAPLALVEIGPSAGLNLLFDRYRYDYGDGLVAGRDASRLTLRTTLESGAVPGLDVPEIAWRRGIDLHPLRVSDPEDVRWGRSLLWPEQLERVARYQAAVAIAQEDPPVLEQGDALEALPEVLALAPIHAHLVVFHSFVLNQFTESERSRLGDLLAEASLQRPVHRIAIEMLSRAADNPEIVHTHYERGKSTTRILGAAHHHGEWLRWEG